MATSNASSTDPVMMKDSAVAENVPAMVPCVQLLKEVATATKEPPFPCIQDPNTIAFLRRHGRVFFITRGPPGSGKGDLLSKLHDLYPGSMSYWADKIFHSPGAPVRTGFNLARSHDVCRETIQHYMKQSVPVIINKSNNLTVWETSPYLQLAATYGYTTILLDMNSHAPFDPAALATANKHGLDTTYMLQRLERWETVNPFATGWAPRPQDAARLLRRYEQLVYEVNSGNCGTELKPVKNAYVYPFIPARICKFGWNERDRQYCCSQLVRKAYGSVDKVTVLGYAMLGDTVVAVVHLTEAQVALRAVPTRYRTDAKGGAVEDWAKMREPAHATDKLCDEMRCTLNLRTLRQQEEHGNDRMSFEPVAAAFSELPPSSHLSILVLGVTNRRPFRYSSVVYDAARCLSAHVASWKAMLSPASRVSADGLKMYPARDDECCLIVDKQEIKLDALFTGYYQSHTTARSGRCKTWSTWEQRPPRRQAPASRNNTQSNNFRTTLQQQSNNSRDAMWSTRTAQPPTGGTPVFRRNTHTMRAKISLDDEVVPKDLP